MLPNFIVNPKPIQWGKDNKQVACQMYTSHMRKNGHPDLCVHKCGFIVHSKLGWLGASPDERVTDPSSQYVNGTVEFKCPYAYRDKKLQEAYKDEHFYCGLNDNGTIFLKVTHQYYHQVQLQLLIDSDIFVWCNFCIYNTKGVLVQRIFLDLKWCTDNIPKLEEYYDNFMLPEIVFPQNKPPYFLSYCVYVLSRVHNIYTERVCPTLHMLCTNTLRKVMTQQPLTAKVLIKLKPYATLKFWQIRACDVLKMRVD